MLADSMLRSRFAGQGRRKDILQTPTRCRLCRESTFVFDADEKEQ